MKGVIISAGNGERLKPFTNTKPKSLINLMGISILERIIILAKRAGIRDFIIVVGYNQELIREKLKDGLNLGVKIDYIFNSEWEKGNGTSLYKVKDYVSENFILLMSDHLFDPKSLKILKNLYLEESNCILAVNSKYSEKIDIEDATKVNLNKNDIIKVGKNLEKWDALDTGMFFFSKTIFNALEESFQQNDYSLSTAINKLAEKGMMKAYDIENKFWCDIDTEKDLKNAKKSLLSQLDKPTDGVIAHYFNRPISKRLSSYLVNFNISPNNITMISFFLMILSGFLFSFPTFFPLVLAAGILAQTSSILDGVDGEIARLKLSETKSGQLLDTVLDRFSDSILIIGITIGLTSKIFSENIVLIGLLALSGTLLTSYTAVFNDRQLKTVAESKNFSLRWGRDTRLIIIFGFSLINQMIIALIILAICGNLVSIYRLIKLFTYEKNIEKKIPLIEAEIVKLLRESSVPEDYEHGLLTKEFAQDLYSDSYSFSIAALTHDIERAMPNEKLNPTSFSDINEFRFNHARNSAKIVASVLNDFKLPKDFIQNVVQLVQNHEFGGSDIENLLSFVDALSFFIYNIDQYQQRNNPLETFKLANWKYRRLIESLKGIKQLN